MLALFDDPDSEEAQAFIDRLEDLGVEIIANNHEANNYKLDIDEPDENELEGFDSGDKVYDVSRTPTHIMETIRGAKISMIFQEPMTSLNPVYTIGNQISEMFINASDRIITTPRCFDYCKGRSFSFRCDLFDCLQQPGDLFFMIIDMHGNPYGLESGFGDHPDAETAFRQPGGCLPVMNTGKFKRDHLCSELRFSR